MKKITAILLLIALIISMVSCADTKTSTDTSSTDITLSTSEPTFEESGVEESSVEESSVFGDSSVTESSEEENTMTESSNTVTSDDNSEVESSEVESSETESSETESSETESSETESSETESSETVSSETEKECNHTWDSGTVNTVSGSGCGAVSTKTYTCTKCKQTKVEQLNGNHTYGEVQYREWTDTFNNGNGDFQSTAREKYQQCTGCNAKKVLVAAHRCTQTKGTNKKTVVSEATCTSPEILRLTCPDCGYYWEWEGDYGYCDTKVIFDGKLTDYTEWTNELYAYVEKCNDCGKVYDDYTVGYGDEGTISETGYHNIKWKAKYSFGVVQGDAYAAGVTVAGSSFYAQNVQYQMVTRNIKYDSNGYVTQCEYRWHDKSGKRYSQVIKVADIPQMFRDAGLDLSKYDLTKISFELKPKNGYIIPNRITFSG